LPGFRLSSTAFSRQLWQGSSEYTWRKVSRKRSVQPTRSEVHPDEVERGFGSPCGHLQLGYSDGDSNHLSNTMFQIGCFPPAASIFFTPYSWRPQDIVFAASEPCCYETSRVSIMLVGARLLLCCNGSVHRSSP
jgi:hypothetical protein